MFVNFIFPNVIILKLIYKLQIYLVPHYLTLIVLVTITQIINSFSN